MRLAGISYHAFGASAEASAVIERIRSAVEAHSTTLTARLKLSEGATSTAEQVGRSEPCAEEIRAALSVAISERDELRRRLAESEVEALSIRAAADEARHEADEAQAEAQRLARDREQLQAELSDRGRHIQRLLHASKRNAASHYGSAAAAKAAINSGGGGGGGGSGGSSGVSGSDLAVAGEEVEPLAPDSADVDVPADAAHATGEAMDGNEDAQGHCDVNRDDSEVRSEDAPGQDAGSARSSIAHALIPAAVPADPSSPGGTAATPAGTVSASAACASGAQRATLSESLPGWGGPSLVTFTPQSPMACMAAGVPAVTVTHAEREAVPAHVASVEPLQPALVLTALDLEHAKEAARAEERGLLRERLVESTTLMDAAERAVLSLDGALGGGVLSPVEAYQELVRERVVSAALHQSWPTGR